MDPASAIWTAQVFSKLSQINKQVLEAKAEMLSAAEEIQSKLDEVILRDLRTAFRHLRDGALSSVPEMQQRELQAARQKFAELVELDSNGTTKGTSGEFSNRYLIALGYLGSFHYYNLSGDKRLAAIQAYECVNRFLEWSDYLTVVETFSLEILNGLFSKNYLKEIGLMEASLQLSRQKLKKSEKEAFRKKLQTLGIAGTSGALSAIVLGELLVIGVPIAVAGAWLFGDRLPASFREKLSGAAKKTLQPLRNTIRLPDTQAKEVSVAQIESSLEDLRSIFENECAERLDCLRNSESSDLMVLDFDTNVSPVMEQLEGFLEENKTILSAEQQATLATEKSSLKDAIQQGDINLIGTTLLSIGAIVRNPADLISLVQVSAEFSKSCADILEQCNELIDTMRKVGVLAYPR
ncbi:MAG: hypothetical protein AAF152_14315 [Cyanobacteria bacterium P01_A01_bin.114]